MQTVYLYEKGCTRKIRFSEKRFLNSYLQNQTPLELEIEGCIITKSTGYFDFRLEDVGKSISIQKYSYIKYLPVDGSIDSDLYFMFIDRIEVNNFNNADSNYYRCYFTIDWWSTIISRYDNIKDKIEGEIFRCHINDIDRDRKPFLDYTLDSAEYIVGKQERNTIKLGGDRKFLYVYSTKRVSTTEPSYRYISNPYFLVGDKSISSALNLYIVGLFPREVDSLYDSIINGKYRIKDNTSQPPSIIERTVTGNCIGQTDGLADSSVVGIYCSNYMPFGSEIDGVFTMDLYDENLLEVFTGQTIPDIQALDFGGLGDRNYVNCALPILRDIPPTIINPNDYNIKTKNNMNIQIPTTYEEYLDNCIVKTFFAPYTFVTLEKNGNHIVLDTAYITNSNLCEYNIIPNMSGYVVYAPSERRKGETAYSLLKDDGLYERGSTNDDYTQLGKIASMIKFSVQSVNTMGKSGNVVEGVFNAGEITANYIEQHSNWEKRLRDGDDGTRVVTGSIGEFVSPLVLGITKPLDDEMRVIRKDLALYGYNTNLHPHQALNQPRRYFNYIKTTKCFVLDNSYNEEVRNDISNMFNGGVWLWNTSEEFGNFEVPNYPLSME